MSKSFKRYFFITGSLIVLVVSILFVSIFVEPLRFYLPYKVIKEFLIYDHIEYEGEQYYIYEPDKMLNTNIEPDFDKKVSVVLVDKDNKPYRTNKTEEAWLCKNDPNSEYIYHISCYYTKDKSLVADFYEFEE